MLESDEIQCDPTVGFERNPTWHLTDPIVCTQILVSAKIIK